LYGRRDTRLVNLEPCFGTPSTVHYGAKVPPPLAAFTYRLPLARLWVMRQNFRTWGQTGRSPVFVPNVGSAAGEFASKHITARLNWDSICYFSAMARLPRVVVVDVAHHVTQRGNARQVVFESDTDRVTYLELLQESSSVHRLSLLGYCLMSNHVHLIAVPRVAAALAQSLKHTHGRYASYWNARGPSSGHVWQGRFYSCPLDDSHLWQALRYVELNPVRAGLIVAPEQWQWSSARAHVVLPVSTLCSK
jgi:REP element-mobilizing transposase RayT